MSHEQSHIETVAGALHEDWRRPRLQPDGSYEPRVKTTNDSAWIAARGTDQVDIANTPFHELPADWQAENRSAASVVVRLMGDRAIDLAQEADRQHAGHVIHEAWLERNDWARGGELDVPFAELPPEEQAKDLAQVAIAQVVLA